MGECCCLRGRRRANARAGGAICCCCWFWIYNTARIKFWRYIFSSGTHHIAYFRVHSRASSLYFSRSVLYILAISGTSGSSGLGSQRREQIDNNTKTKGKQNDKKKGYGRAGLRRDLPFEIVSAGDHWDLNMSRQIDPLLLIFGWYMRVVKATLGGLNG